MSTVTGRRSAAGTALEKAMARGGGGPRVENGCRSSSYGRPDQPQWLPPPGLILAAGVISDLVRMEWLVGPLRKGFLNLLIQLLDAPGAGCDRRGYAEPSWPPPEE